MINNNTKGISFTNFRRFKEFSMLEFGNITYMVGRNNSGKSTMVKALLLILDYLQNQLSDTFSFDNQALEDANIVTFGRAKCNLIDEPEIVFNYKLGNYNITIHISGNDDRTKANVNVLRIQDEVNGYKLTVNYNTKRIQVVKKSFSNSTIVDTNEELEKLHAEINRLKEARENITSKVSKEALQLVDLINKMVERRNKIVHSKTPQEDVDDIEYDLEYPLNYQMEDDDSLWYSGDHSSEEQIEELEDFDKKQASSVMEVDLHIHQLVNSYKGMTKHEILTYQLNTAKRQLESAISSRKQKIVFIHGSGEDVLKLKLDYLFKKYDNVISYEVDFENYEGEAIEVSIEYRIENYSRTEDNQLKEIISVFLYHNTIAYKQWIEQRGKNLSDENSEDDISSDIVELDNTKEELKDWMDKLVKNIEQESYYYLGANPSKQSALFYLRDKDNALSQAIHNFYQLGIKKGDEEWELVLFWMNEFEVGDDFHIEFYAGEAYEFHVFKEGKKNHLSDKGMGSLQAMMLILRVASLIRSNKKHKKTITLLVEEPELNLHPALQSKLTEFFHELNKKYKLNFIIETHSEYIIRRSQVFTKKEEYGDKDSLNPNPFKTFYFPIDDSPYEMRYRKDGAFMDEFRKGFFEVSSDLAFDIL
ncbi:AAA family ATPase [Flavobacteriaceae bacterium S0862]|nr:AAA family ATPase [Flavobacteriaceae bacterium S0862]